MTAKLDLALELAGQIEAYPLEECGPSDDPDMITAYVMGWNRIATRFLGVTRRLGDAELTDMLDDLGGEAEHIVEAYGHRDRLMIAIDYLREAAANPDYEAGLGLNAAFVAPQLLHLLRSAEHKAFDYAKLVRFCEELNDAYRRGHYLTSALLIRAVMNHVPPIFGQTSFSGVVGQASRSIKPMLERLEKEARPIADLHTHYMIRAKEPLPTRNQIEPYKGCFELLINEIIAQAD